MSQNDNSSSYYRYEDAYVEYLRSNHPHLLQADAEVVAAIDVNGNLKMLFMEIKLLLSEMKVQIGEVFLKINMVNGENKAAIVVDKFEATIFVFLVTGLVDVVMLK